MQDGVHLLRHPKLRFSISLPFISAAQHTVKFPPKGPWSFTTATRTGKVPLKVPSRSSLGRLILRAFPRGVRGGSSGGT